MSNNHNFKSRILFMENSCVKNYYWFRSLLFQRVSTLSQNNELEQRSICWSHKSWDKILGTSIPSCVYPNTSQHVCLFTKMTHLYSFILCWITLVSTYVKEACAIHGSIKGNTGTWMMVILQQWWKLTKKSFQSELGLHPVVKNPENESLKSF